jgi:hypothetical protein
MMIFLSGATRDWGCQSQMMIGLESWWYFLVERHVIEAVSLMVIDFESGWYFLVERHVIEAVSLMVIDFESGWYFLV